jgi:hypothetical protein
MIDIESIYLLSEHAKQKRKNGMIHKLTEWQHKEKDKMFTGMLPALDAYKKEQENITSRKEQDALNAQVGGSHYKDMVIQPVEYITKNNIPFIEGSVIKYVSRWRNKGGKEDIKKAIHFLELLLQIEE